MIGFGLEFEGADDIAAGACFQPAEDSVQQLFGIADHIGKEPVHGACDSRIESKAAADAVIDFWHALYVGIERGLVDAEDTTAKRCQNPGPAAGRCAEINAELAGLRPTLQQGEGFPEFQISSSRRIFAVFLKQQFAVGKGGRCAR